MRLLGPIFSLFLLLCVASGTSTPASTEIRGDALIRGDASLCPGVAVQDVRLRKMHLVRPDLIHYPLWIEVCC